MIVVTIVPKQYFLVYFFVVELRTFFFFLFLRNMKLWKEAFMERREREIMITVAELVLFVFSFGCAFCLKPSTVGLFTNTERSVVEYSSTRSTSPSSPSPPSATATSPRRRRPAASPLPTTSSPSSSGCPPRCGPRRALSRS